MKKPHWRGPLYAALAVLFLLHNDLWLWHDARLVLGLPAGLAYHAAFALVTAAVLGLLAYAAWPEDLDSPACTHNRPGEGEPRSS